ncbi:FGGY carbohydrate kinase domain-containing protein isoform X5 [Durio zibethinus]|uniref:FGGY carbohydrate kinase domain-containing protein isoform X5 n=1 Tax=Durio zibethinus TaxID=66656 RepID=A0A6P5ZRR9_DURZI|nr:FGGY carbohydrate kinase domain-containing protein isoform X5 [Durio zibethinus]
MSGKGRAWSDTTPLLRQLQQPHPKIRSPSSPSAFSHSISSPLFLEMAAAISSSSASPRSVFLGVDVGTGSARAGLFDEKGKLLGSASSPIQIWKEGDCIEQSSTDIWHAICSAVKSACTLANIEGEEVKGIGFAATCSLVAVDADGSPVTVSHSGDSRRNIIVWMDHRAAKQAEKINSRNSPVLQYCGGSVSPEMQPPKLLWVKENLQESWAMVFRWMDLSDWLSYRATGDDTRSLCTTVCKWTYLGHAHMQQMNEKDSRDMEACGWDDDFWEEIGLGDLIEGHHAKIAMIPEYWLTEGGQSATGALLDYIIENHVASPRLANRAASQKISLFLLLNNMLESLMREMQCPFIAALTEDIHVLPDYHGNRWHRSPIADPKAKGVVFGLTLDTSEKQLARIYLATMQAIAYGTRHIVEHCNANGHKIDTLLACGGLSKNALFIQEHADIIGCPIILPRESESVLLGAAILGAVAAKKYTCLSEAMKALNAAGQVIHPSKDPRVKKYHDAKYRIFRELYEQQLSQRSIMAQALA